MTLCTNCDLDTATHTVNTPRGKRAHLCEDCYSVSTIILVDGKEFAWYTPQLHQRPYHESNSPNLLALGTRATGKSTMMRKDAIIRCMMFPGFKVLILRRKIPDLQKSHLRFINAEMKQLGDEVGYYRETTHDVKFTNGSFIQFSHCEGLKDVENYLSSEWDLIVFDELSSFTLEMFLLICAAARSPEDAPYTALVRAGSNPMGIGAQWMKEWFVDHEVNLSDYPDYLPEDFEMQFSMLNDNRYVNRKDYEKRLRNLPDHVRRAWLLGEFVIEGAYFSDFKRNTDDGKPWHVIADIPTLDGRPIFDYSWMAIYRAIDWGYFPDPAVCLWIAVLPNKRTIVFKERRWVRTLAGDVAKQIKRESEGMHIIETYCDPTMDIKEGQQYSLGELFEQQGVPLTSCKNDRELYGYSIHNYLNTLIDEKPQLQIVQPMGPFGCKDLIRTIPMLQMDPANPARIANGEDHWAVALAYFCMASAVPAREPGVSSIPQWMRKKPVKRRY
jgi:terminase large subunit-like protein